MLIGAPAINPIQPCGQASDLTAPKKPSGGTPDGTNTVNSPRPPKGPLPTNFTTNSLVIHPPPQLYR
ncbi:MAG: hypothetical protein HY851_00715 [candidate division Zixibacteria bacterium]|nr:hypothetical protein [candidate division Zixibacteria bacterium]